MNKLSILIPVFNEVGNIEEVIKQITNLQLKNIQKEIIVVDDGSTDGTIQVLDKIQDKYHFKLIKHQKNSGKGSAVKDAIKASTGDILLIQDADLEYKVQDYPDLLKPILAGETDFVLGSRHMHTTGWKFLGI